MRKIVYRIAPVLAMFVLGTPGCARRSGLPDPGSQAYRDFCTAFYTGLAGLQSGEDVRAKDDLTKASEVAPGEPAVWANLGVFELRRQEYDAALKSAATARSLAPESSRIEALLGQIESKRGEVPACLAHYKKATELDSKNLKARYAMSLELERQNNDQEAERNLELVLGSKPGNTGVLLEAARLSAKLGDVARERTSLQKLAGQSADWPEAAKKQLASVEQAAGGTDVRSSAVQVQFLRNVLLRVPAYQRSMDEVRTPTTLVFEPFLTFLKLPAPSSRPAAPDTELGFQAQALPAGASSKVMWVGTIAFNDEAPPSIIWADALGLHVGDGPPLQLPMPAGDQLPLHAVAGADLNYDYKTDLVIASSGGLKIYRQVDLLHFTDVTAETKLDTKIVRGPYTGAWAFDVDLDGDLDIVLGVPNGEPLVLRNNGDGTFAAIHPFKGITGLLGFAAADIDGDGDPDVAMIDEAGRLKVFSNERLGEYKLLQVDGGHVRALASADIDGDGLPDFIFLRDDLAILRLSFKTEWNIAEIARAANSPHLDELVVADLDNNGALDLVAGDQVFLNDGRTFAALSSRLPGSVRAVADLNGDGRLDLVSVNNGAGNQLLNHGAKSYQWQTIRTRAAHASGDQRINSFGIGGEIEIRADLLTEKQIINSPILHFGLGEHTKVDFARIVWPNGFVQSEFDLKSNQAVLAQQRLKGSCPFLFAWDGERMRFVKDAAPWSPALGLHINAQQVAGIYQTQEWFKIPGEALRPHDSYYDLRVTGEYWETFYIDHYSLLVVDHPLGTQVYSDERFAVPPPPLKVYETQEPKPFLRATDDDGDDVSSIVSALDRRYLDNFGRGQYQGVTRDHWVELQLPDYAPRVGPLYLIANGWLHPTDGTTNIAMSQHSNLHPEGLSIQVPDGRGSWKTAREGLGFPAGRLKTIVLDLERLWAAGAERKLRLRTNMEIYWDQLEWAQGSVEESVKVTRLGLLAADLEYRGFSEIKQVNDSSPEIPNYGAIASDGQRWRDMEGYFTRYGDVRELLARVDDRIVIINGGDELRLRFAAPPAPPAGWVRDYMLVGDGWIKDGDYNSVFSKTVLPLPYHGMKDYAAQPRTLEEDPAYRMHPSDWQTYHTRYVTPESFVTALWEKQ